MKKLAAAVPVVAIGLLVVGLVAGFLIGWFAGPAPGEVEDLRRALERAEDEVASLRSQLEEKLMEIEELRKPQVIRIRADVIGPGPMGIKKAENLRLAGERLNQVLAMLGLGARVEVDVEFSELKWGPFTEKFFTDFEAGNAPDIVTLRETARLAEGGFIIPLDDYVREFWDLHYFAFYPNLWEGARWKGSIWGVPHDISPTGVWFRKDVLRRLGYSDAEIDSMLPSTGQTTIDVIARLAKEAVDAGLVEFGILHRPSPGPGLYATMLAFGADAYNPETGRLVFDKPALLEFFKWHRRMVEEGVIPPEPPSWSTIHSTFVEGKTFSTWASHVGTPAEWMEKYGLTEETLRRDLGFMPFPPVVEGASPVSVHDFPLYFITSQSKNPEVAFLIITFATTAEAASIHSDFSSRPPYRFDALTHPVVADNWYVQRVAPSAQTVKPVPLHPKFWAFMDRVFEALKGVEAGVITPEQAVGDLESFIRSEVPDAEIIG